MKRILIIDDDAAIRLLYEEELSEEGYDIISSDGEKGLLQLIAARDPISYFWMSNSGAEVD